MKEVVKGYYRCVKCLSEMISIVETDETGRALYNVTPLFCPRCASLKEVAEALRALDDLRLVHALANLLDQ